MTTLPFDLPIYAWLGCSLVFTGFWWQQQRTSNANLVDVAWAASIGVLAVLYALFGSTDMPTRAVIAVLPAVWSARLSWHILQRSGHIEEDSRYAYLRAHWKDRTQLKFFGFYQAQALTVMAFSFPFFVLANLSESPGAWQIGLALAIWSLSVAGEAVADYQLTAWRNDPANRGKTCRSGLWRYSRHPNYFFEWLHWWSYVPLALGSAWWWLPLLIQALMLTTLLFGTGIPHAERQALIRRGADYREYQRTTSAFIPWWPKQGTR